MSNSVIDPRERADPSDERLLASIQARDEKAFDDFYIRSAPAVARFAWSVSHSRDVVDELLQETFLLVWRRPDQVRVVNGSALPWLLVTCRNHARNLSRREDRHRDTARLVENAARNEVSDNDAVHELRWAIGSISALPEIDRMVCELVLLQGLSYREAARMLSISVGSVGKRLHRSRRRLRKDEDR